MKTIKNLVMVLLICTMITTTVGLAKSTSSINPVQGNSVLEKSAADKIKADPPKIANAPTANISKEEQTLVDQLINAKKAGNTKNIQNIESKIAALHGRVISYIKADPYVPTALSNASNVSPKWTTNNPCVSCGNSHGNLNRPSIVHDSLGYVWTAVSDGKYIYIYRSYDKGKTWSYFRRLDSVYNFGSSVSIASGGDYVFLAADERYILDPDTGNRISVWRINVRDSSMTRTNFGGGGQSYSDARIVTDNSEYPGNWWVYMIYKNSGSSIMYTKSTDSGNSWQTPSWISSTSSYTNRYSMDYGANTLYIAMEDSNSPRHISVIAGPSFGSYWLPKFVLTSGSDDVFRPEIASVKSTDHSNPNVVVTYTRNWANSGDYDIWYAYYTSNGGWHMNNCLACYSKPSNEDMSVVTTDDYPSTFQVAYEYDTGTYPYNINFKWTLYNTPWSLGGSGITQIASGWIPIYPSIAPLPVINGVGPDAGVVWLDFGWNQIYFDGAWLQ